MLFRSQFIKPLLYPTFDPNIVQVDKNPDEIGYSKWVPWFYNNPHVKEILAPWESAIRAEQNMIHPDFFRKNDQGRIVGYTGYWSRVYKVGTLTRDYTERNHVL